MRVVFWCGSRSINEIKSIFHAANSSSAASIESIKPPLLLISTVPGDLGISFCLVENKNAFTKTTWTWFGALAGGQGRFIATQRRWRTSADLDTIFIRERMTSRVAPLSSPMVCTSSTSTNATVPTWIGFPTQLALVSHNYLRRCSGPEHKEQRRDNDNRHWQLPL